MHCGDRAGTASENDSGKKTDSDKTPFGRLEDETVERGEQMKEYRTNQCSKGETSIDLLLSQLETADKR